MPLTQLFSSPSARALGFGVTGAVPSGKPYWIVSYPLNEENDILSVAANPNTGVIVGSPSVSAFYPPQNFVAAFDDAGNGAEWQKKYSSFDSFFGTISVTSNAVFVGKYRSGSYFGVVKHSLDGTVFETELYNPINVGNTEQKIFNDTNGDVYFCNATYATDVTVDSEAIFFKLNSTDLSPIWRKSLTFPGGWFVPYAANAYSDDFVYAFGGGEKDSIYTSGLFKLDAMNGSFIWGSTAPSFADDDYTYAFNGKSIANDTSGNIYVAGPYSAIDDSSYSPYSAILKYGSNGTLLSRWIFSDSVSSIKEAKKILVDEDGSIYLLMKTNDSTAIGVVLKLDQSGNIVWQRNLNCQNVEMDLGVSSSGANVLYFAARFYTGYIGYTWMIMKLPTDGSLTGTYSIPVYEWGSETVSWLDSDSFTVVKDAPSVSSFALTVSSISFADSLTSVSVSDTDYSAVKVDIEV